MWKVYEARILTGILVCALSSPAYSTVIYDVLAVYDEFEYSFSMEFADDVGIKTENDLISSSPGSDFFDEAFVNTDTGTDWNLSVDAPTVSLTFDPTDPTSIQFSSIDRFVTFATFTTIATLSLDESGMFGDVCTFDPPCIPWGRSLDSLSVTAHAVPAPPAVLLFLTGLGLMGFVKRRRQTAI